MRVRHKTERREVEYRVIDEGVSYWVGHGVDRLMAGACEAVALPKADYEPVPEARWEGITAQCEVREGTIYHHDSRAFPTVSMVGIVKPPYRLRLVNHVLIVNGALIVERETC